MLKSFFINVVLFGFSVLMAMFIVKVFDDWYQDGRERREERRRADQIHRHEMRRRRQEGRYE